MLYYLYLQGPIHPERASNIYHYVEPFVTVLQSKVPSFSEEVAEVDQWEVRPATVHVFNDQQIQGYFGGKTYKGKIESQSRGNGFQHEILAVAVKKLEGMILCCCGVTLFSDSEVN